MRQGIKPYLRTLRAALKGRLSLGGNYSAAFEGAPVVLEDTYGIRFILYPWNRPYLDGLVQRRYDKSDLRVIPLLVREGDVVFDIGAHCGEYCVFLSRLCGPRGRVFAFEPVPDTYWMLRETLALNRCQNVLPAQVAMCDKVGNARMHIFEPQFSGWNSLGMPRMVTPEGKRASPSQSVEVPTETLDHFCSAENIERIHFMKVDVEGFEKLVFRGAECMLRHRRVDYICFEISQAPLRGAGLASREVFDVLKEYGYPAYSFDESSGTFAGPIEDTSEEWRNFYASWRDLSAIRDGASGRGRDQ